MNKALLNQVKTQFSLNLESHGVKAVFASTSDKQSNQEQQIAQTKRENRRKNANVYQVVDHGKASFNFDESKPMSYYLFMATKNGTAKNMWNKGLEDVIKQAGVRTGDYIKVKKIKDSNNQSFKVKQWQVEKVILEPEIKQETLTIREFGQARYQF